MVSRATANVLALNEAPKASAQHENRTQPAALRQDEQDAAVDGQETLVPRYVRVQSQDGGMTMKQVAGAAHVAAARAMRKVAQRGVGTGTEVDPEEAFLRSAVAYVGAAASSVAELGRQTAIRQKERQLAGELDL